MNSAYNYLLVAVLGALSCSADAQWSAYSSEAEWMAAAGVGPSDVVSIDFAGLPGTEITDQYASAGVLFTDAPPPEICITPLLNGRCVGRVGTADPLTIEFVGGVAGIGMQYGEHVRPRIETFLLAGDTTPAHTTATAGGAAPGFFRFWGEAGPRHEKVKIYSSVGTAQIITLMIIPTAAPPAPVVVECISGAAGVIYAKWERTPGQNDYTGWARGAAIPVAPGCVYWPGIPAGSRMIMYADRTAN